MTKSNYLKRLDRFYPSVWLDYIRQDLIAGGELRHLIEADERGRANPDRTASGKLPKTFRSILGRIDALVEPPFHQGVAKKAPAAGPADDATRKFDGATDVWRMQKKLCGGGRSGVSANKGFHVRRSLKAAAGGYGPA